MQSREFVVLNSMSGTKKIPSALIAVCVLASLQPAKAMSVEFTDITQKMAAATVSVGICDLEQIKGEKSTKVPSRGSGFFINDKGLFITARHVLPLPLPKGKSVLLFQKRPDDKSVFTTTTEVVYDWPDLDIVVLRVSETAAKAFGWIPLSSAVPSPGDEVGTFGYPVADLELKGLGRFDASSLYARVMKTIVSNVEVRELQSGKSKIKRTVIETQRAFANGNSGSPLVSAKDGKVVGVVSGAFLHPMGIENVSGGRGRKIEIPTLVSYGNNVAISEILSRLKSSEYFQSW